jgi:hypothetical protein
VSHVFFSYSPLSYIQCSIFIGRKPVGSDVMIWWIIYTCPILDNVFILLTRR